MSSDLIPTHKNTSTEAPNKTIRQRLDGPDFRAAVAKVLPKHLTPDRFVRIAILAITRTPKLAACDQASFFGALMTLSQYGLEPDGRRAHLIPFENRKRNCTECQLIIDWKGLAELAMRSGLVSCLHADVVYTGDLFEYSAGRVKTHVPWWLRTDKNKPSERGEIIGAYSTAEFKDGSSKSEAMSIDEINAIRNRSRAATSGPWVTDYNEMAKKTVFRRLSKWLTLSPEFRDAVEADDAIDVESSAVDSEFLADTTPSNEISDASEGASTSAIEPPKPADPKPEPPKTPATNIYLSTLKTSIAREKLDERKVLKAIHGLRRETEGAKTLDALDPYQDALKAVIAGWPDVVAAVKEMK